MEINKKIKEILKNKGMTQLELAERMEMQPSHLSRILTGKAEPNTDTINRIAKALEMPVSALYNEEIQKSALVEAALNGKR